MRKVPSASPTRAVMIQPLQEELPGTSIEWGQSELDSENVEPASTPVSVPLLERHISISRQLEDFPGLGLE
jgi:hypothetical protein